jgi:methionyl-tRNA formyltransferase
VWAIINGEEKTGVTLFKLDNGVDDGDIIAQRSFPIGFNDTIKGVYDNATKHTLSILTDALANVNNIRYRAQDKKKLKAFPQRRPEDGRINLSKNALEIYNFIRAQSWPYPGAFSTINGKKIIIWNAGLLRENIFQDRKIGEIISDKNGTIINLQDGALKIGNITFNGHKDSLYNIANFENLWGMTIDS